jgi:hypothetical protein
MSRSRIIRTSIKKLPGDEISGFDTRRHGLSFLCYQVLDIDTFEAFPNIDKEIEFIDPGLA